MSPQSTSGSVRIPNTSATQRLQAVDDVIKSRDITAVTIHTDRSTVGLVSPIRFRSRIRNELDFKLKTR